MKLNEFGKTRANVNASDTNSIRVAAPVQGTPGADTYADTVTGTEILESVSIDGVSYDINSPDGLVLNAGDAEIQAAIIQALKDAGEFDIKLSYAYATGDVALAHYGQKTLESFTTDQDTYALARSEDYVQRQDLVIQLVGTLGDVSNDNGVTTEALANDPYAHVGTPATDDATAAQLVTDLEAALDALTVDYTDVTAVRNDTDEAYDIEIEGIVISETIQIGDRTMAIEPGSYAEAFE